MIKIAICDDEAENLKVHEEYVRKYITANKIIAEIYTFLSGEFFWHDIQEGVFYDLILLDIEMPEKNGLEIAESLKKMSPESLTIFITSHRKFAVESFELSIFRYVPKDCIKNKLEHAIKDALTYIELQKEQTYTLLTSTQMQKIPYKSIVYIQKDGKYALMVLQDREIRIRKSLAQVFEEIHSNDFVYTDRSCIANLIHITKLDAMDVVMSTGVYLPVSKKRYRELRDIINCFWGDKI